MTPTQMAKGCLASGSHRGITGVLRGCEDEDPGEGGLGGLAPPTSETKAHPYLSLEAGPPASI